MGETTSTVKGLFWHPEEDRLRTPFRIPVTFGLILLAAQFILAVLDGLRGVFSLPDPVFLSLVVGLVTLAVVGIGWFIDRRYVSDMGVSPDGQWTLDAIAGLGVGFAMTGAVVVVLRLLGMATLVETHAVTDPDFVLAGGSPLTSLLYGLLFFAALGAFEEVLVRGYLLVNAAEGLRRYLPDARTAVAGAVALTALLFGALHAANPGGTALSLPNLLLAGVFLGATYAVTGRLAFAIGLHIAWNFGLGSLFGLPVSGLTTDTAYVPVRVDGADIVTGGSFGPEGGLVMLLALAVATAGFAWWARRQYGGLTIQEGIAIPDLWIADDPDS